MLIKVEINIISSLLPVFILSFYFYIINYFEHLFLIFIHLNSISQQLSVNISRRDISLKTQTHRLNCLPQTKLLIVPLMYGYDLPITQSCKAEVCTASFLDKI